MLNPKFDYGCEVRVIKNIRNDTYQGGQTKGELLVRRGTCGFVRQSGVYKQDQIIYQVHFLETDIIIGCKESELTLASLVWVTNEFEYGDSARLKISLSVAGELVASKGELTKVLSVDRSDPQDILYRIQLGAHDLMVPERALIAGESI
ncbi:MAG: nitrogen fixation protein NifZ [Colwellia sp.]